MKTKICVAAALTLAGVGGALGQSPPGSIPVGPMFAYPDLEVAVRRDSNIALQPDATRVADTIWLIRPSIRLEAKQGPNLYNVGYRGEYGRFDKQGTDDFENHELFADGGLFLDARNRLTVRLQYLDRVDPRGTLNLAATPTPNRWRQPSIQGMYTYGAQDAQGRLELQGGHLQKRYVNNRFATNVLDRDQTDYGATFLWRVMPKTYATFTLRQSDHEYAEPTVTLDSTDTFALVGVRWEATALTTGRFSLGRQQKKFDNAARPDFSGTAWEGGINWKPLTYSSVDFNTKRSTNESTGLGNFILSQAHQLTWTHAWSSRVTTNLLASHLTDKFDGSPPLPAAGGASREDTTTSGGLRITYAFRRWLKFGAEYTLTNRDSNDPAADYKRNQLMLLMAATL